MQLSKQHFAPPTATKKNITDNVADVGSALLKPEKPGANEKDLFVTANKKHVPDQKHVDDLTVQ